MEPLHELVVIGVGGAEGVVDLLGERHRRLRRNRLLSMVLVEIGMAAAGDAEILLDQGENRFGLLVAEFFGMLQHPLDVPLDPLDVVADRVARLPGHLRIDRAVGGDVRLVINNHGLR